MAPHVEIINEETRVRMKRLGNPSRLVDGIWYTRSNPNKGNPSRMIDIRQNENGREITGAVRAGDVRIVKPKRK